VARLCAAFGMKVMVCDPAFPVPRIAADGWTPVTDIAAALPEVDVLTLHCPLGEATRHMINREILGLMKPTAWLINAARGPLVDEAALIEALSSGRLEAAGLDVQLREPPDPANPLLKLPNVVLSPHNAAAPLECNEKMSIRAAKNMLELFDVLDPGYVVTRKPCPIAAMSERAGRIAVIQPLPGIGDMIWHLPHIRAIARWFGRPVTLVAKPRSAADELFSTEITIESVMWLDRNPERRRGRHDGVGGFARLVVALRRGAFEAVVVLHHSRKLAAAAFAAGISHRYGYGFGTQRLFLNRAPFLHRSLLSLHPHEQATRWLAAAAIPLGDLEPQLAVTKEARAAARMRLGVPTGPLVAIGIGTSERYKQWGAERFAELAGALLDDGWPCLVVAGGPAEAELAQTIQRRLGDRGERVRHAIGWKLRDLAALLAETAFYVGNDTGAMNLAAAVGIRTYGLFGARPPFHHSSAIVPILPPDGRPDIAIGMARITTRAVLDAIRADRSVLEPLIAASQQW
jgi:lipopolysaccharide heptosyltransferase II